MKYVIICFVAFGAGFIFGVGVGQHGTGRQCINGRLYKQDGPMLIQQGGACISLTEDPSIGQAEQQ